MFRTDAIEAAALVTRMLKTLLSQMPVRGREGADLRRACGQVIANAEALCMSDEIGPPLDECFDLARVAGISQRQVAIVRASIEAEEPVLLGAVLLKNAGIDFCLATEGRIIGTVAFTSREDVEGMKKVVNVGFGAAEEIAADEMDQAVFIALTRLHAAVMFFLVETARPLPQIVTFRFHSILPSLLMSYKFYDTAARGDELRIENKVVHPAFMVRQGRALSA